MFQVEYHCQAGLILQHIWCYFSGGSLAAGIHRRGKRLAELLQHVQTRFRHGYLQIILLKEKREKR